jgi:WD40 repeat protein
MMKTTNSIGQVVLPVLIAFCAGCLNPEEPVFNNPHDPDAANYVPTAPDMRIASASRYLVQLTWATRAVGYVAGFVVERHIGFYGTFQRIASLSPTATSYDDSSGLILDSVYYYRVGAVGKNGAVSYSIALNVSIHISFLSPSDLSFASRGPTRIRLRWVDHSALEQGYRVERTSTGSSVPMVATLPPNANMFEDSTVSPGAEYTYRVYAFLDSMKSIPISVKLGYLPPGISQVRTITLGGYALKSLASGDGCIFVTTWGTAAPLISMLSASYYHLLTHLSLTACVASSPSGEFIATAIIGGTGYGDMASVWNASSYFGVAHPAGLGQISSMVFSPDGSLMGIAGAGGITFYGTQLWNQFRLISSGAVNALSFSPDNQHIVGGTATGIVMWRMSDGSQERLFSTSGQPSRAVGFTPDGLSIVGGSDDGIIAVWRASDGTLLRSWQTPGPVQSLAVSPDGEIVVSAGDTTGAVNLWNLSTGLLQTTLTGHTLKANAVVCTFDGRLVASASDDGSIRVWSLGQHWWVVP